MSYRVLAILCHVTEPNEIHFSLLYCARSRLKTCGNYSDSERRRGANGEKTWKTRNTHSMWSAPPRSRNSEMRRGGDQRYAHKSGSDWWRDASLKKCGLWLDEGKFYAEDVFHFISGVFSPLGWRSGPVWLFCKVCFHRQKTKFLFTVCSDNETGKL